MRRAILLAVAATLAAAPPARGSHAEPPLPLGTVARGPAAACLPGFRCEGFAVSCPAVRREATGTIAIADAAEPRGLVALFSGGPGKSFWGEESPAALRFLDDLRGRGLSLVLVRWKTPWLAAVAGEEAGPAHLACRPATVVRWIADELYAPLELAPTGGACGFCITGNSGGASQVAYTLSHYGLDGIVDAVVPTSGPVHAALSKACLPGGGALRYVPIQARRIDISYGARSGGPCERGDASFARRFAEDGADGGDRTHPSTRVHVIVGGGDGSNAPGLARQYVRALRAGGSPVKLEVVAGMGHDVHGSADGLAALRAALLGRADLPVATEPATPAASPTPAAVPSPPAAEEPGAGATWWIVGVAIVAIAGAAAARVLVRRG